MPRYFFNVQDGRSYPDLQGTILGDLNAARVEAVRFAGALLNDGARAFWDGAAWRMEVHDEFGLLLFSLNFTADQAPSIRNIPFEPELKPLERPVAPV